MPFFRDEVLLDICANRPTTGPTIGALFFASDTFAGYRWNGTTWDQVSASRPAGLAGLGSGVATFLGTPSSANLAAALTDETGTGAAVFAASPALTGTPTAPTPLTADNSTTIATTAYVQAALAVVGSLSFTDSWTSQTTRTITHNLGTKDVDVAVYDSSDVKVDPESVTTTDGNTVTLTFGSAFTGRALIIAKGAAALGASNFADDETPSGTIDGANTTFTLLNTPSPGGSLKLYVNGVRYLVSTDYTLATATITFTSAPDTGAILRADYRY
jgi:hypothetical protein